MGKCWQSADDTTVFEKNGQRADNGRTPPGQRADNGRTHTRMHKNAKNA